MAASKPAEDFEESRDAVMDEWEAWEHHAYSFLRSHTDGAIYLTPSLKMGVTRFNAQIRFMVQLYFCLSKFVNFYPSFARSNATRTWPVFPPTNGWAQRVQEGQEWPRLNDTELLRLQRGLLRYELTCRLFGLPAIAASCNRDVCDAVVNYRDSSLAANTWVLNPFSELLPIDEVEEIVCASVYVGGLHDILLGNACEEFYNHLVDMDPGCDDGMLDTDGSDARRTARYWLSKTKVQILDFTPCKPCYTFDWTESMIRLGLVFLDRLARSSVAERRELMRYSFNNVIRPNDDSFLWRHWDDVVNVRCTAEGFAFGVGPHCNSTIQASISDDSVTELIRGYGGNDRLRRSGWVFFDDKSKLRSLGLPHHATVSTMCELLEKEGAASALRLPFKPNIPESALAARFTEKEWKELIIDKYAQKDRRDDYQAMSQFAAGARAVVDFKSTQLPHLD